MKNKFKVGDRIIGTCKKNIPYSLTYKGWIGEVIDIINKERIIVSGPNANNSENISTDVDPTYFKLSKPLTAKELNNKALNI